MFIQMNKFIGRNKQLALFRSNGHFAAFIDAHHLNLYQLSLPSYLPSLLPLSMAHSPSDERLYFEVAKIRARRKSRQLDKDRRKSLPVQYDVCKFSHYYLYTSLNPTLPLIFAYITPTYLFYKSQFLTYHSHLSLTYFITAWVYT
jgi:predicted CDP-diglyceride synthetase/phosphatidate cytidylyltransferase